MMKAHNRYFYYFLVAFTAVFWGSSHPAVRFLVLDGMDPFLVCVLRIALSALFCLGALLLSKEKFDLPAFKRHFWPFFTLSLLGAGGFLSLLCVGLEYAEAGKSGLIVGSSPIFVVIFSYFFLKEPLSKAKLAGVCIAIAGIFLTEVGDNLAAGGVLSFDRVDLLLLATCLCWAAYTVASRAYGHLLSYWQGMFLTFGISAVLAIPLLIYYVPAIAGLSLKQWLVLAFLGVLCGGVGYFFWNKCINVLGASVCGMFNSLTPLSAVILSAWLLQETLTLPQLAGGALIIGGVLLGMRRVSLPVNYETGESL